MSDKEQITNCANCEIPYNIGFNFCPHCGQKSDDEVTISNLFYNTITNYFSFDARFFKSFIPLIFRPGYLPKKFVEGKRLLYLHPAQMYLFVSVVFFFLFSFIQREQTTEINKAFGENKTNLSSLKLDSTELRNAAVKQLDTFSKNLIEKPARFGMSKDEAEVLDSILRNKNLSKNNGIFSSFNFSEEEIDSLIASGADDNTILKFVGMEDDAGYLKRKFYGQILRFYKNRDAGTLLQTFYDALPIAMFFLLPIFALLVYLFYFNKGRFAHHLVFSFYFFSFLFASFAIMVGLNLIWDIPDWIDALVVFSTILYLLLALKRYYMQGWILTFFKTGFLSFLFMLIVLPLTAGLVMTYAFLFY